jgi:DNA-directed RNA polymerase specialized sigma24 family protein
MGRSRIEMTGVPANEETTTGFAAFVAAHERALRQSLTAALGVEWAREATAEALAYGWEHWDRVGAMENSAGYLYRIGLHWGRKAATQRSVVFPAAVVEQSGWVEPGLPAALAGLSEKQRLVVYLVHGHDWTLSEVAHLLKVSKGTVQKHMERGMARLRAQLKVDV